MQRFIGSALIIFATTGTGIMYGFGLKEELERLMYLRHVISLIKGEMEHARVPLGFVFEHLARTVMEPYRAWFLDMLEQIEKCKKKSFAEIWSDGVDRKLPPAHFKKKYRMGLKRLGEYIAGLNEEESALILWHYLKQLDQEIDVKKAEMYTKKRLGNCIGVMGGIFIVILLI